MATGSSDFDSMMNLSSNSNIPGQNEAGNLEIMETKTTQRKDFSCNMCNITCNSESTYQLHINGTQHSKNCLTAMKGGQIEVGTSETMKTKTTKKKDFSCKICNITCNSRSTYQLHINGTQHTKNCLTVMKGGTVTTKPNKKKMENLKKEYNKSLLYTDGSLDKISQPVIGLHFVCEYRDELYNTDTYYMCILCPGKPMDADAVLAHIVDTEHRLAYLKQHHTDYYDECTNSVDPAETAEQYATQIEADIGRTQVVLFLKQDPFTVDVHENKDGDCEKNQWTESEHIRKKSCQLDQRIQKTTEPMLGLRFITEFHKFQDQQGYTCELCAGAFIGKGCLNLVMKHLTSGRHNMNYLRCYYMDFYKELKQVQNRLEHRPSTLEFREIVKKYATQIEAKEGREPVTYLVRVQDADDLNTVLDILSTFEIEDELDADLALKATNLLGRALFKYKFNEVPDELLTEEERKGLMQDLAMDEG